MGGDYNNTGAVFTQGKRLQNGGIPSLTNDTSCVKEKSRQDQSLGSQTVSQQESLPQR